LQGETQSENQAGPGGGAGRLKQSVCKWCINLPLETLCEQAAEIGYRGIDLLSEGEWAVPPRHGLICTTANGPGNIPNGWNDPANHERLIAESLRLLPLVGEAGIPNMIVFSGNRRGMSDDNGVQACVDGLQQIMPEAERCGVTVIMELLNARVDHGDYFAHLTPLGVRIAEGVGSDRFKLLYDIYHMQIDEGDVIRTIRKHHRHIGHYHTAGNPGRRDLDADQELQYPAICRAIADTGFDGYLAQEFMPKGEPVAALRSAYNTCAV